MKRNNHMQTVNIGAHMRALRQERGMTLREVAALAHTSVSTLSDIERGDMNPSFGMLESIGTALGLHISEFFGVVFNPLSPDEQALIDAYRAGDMQSIMKLTLKALDN